MDTVLHPQTDKDRKCQRSRVDHRDGGMVYEPVATLDGDCWPMLNLKVEPFGSSTLIIVVGPLVTKLERDPVDPSAMIGLVLGREEDERRQVVGSRGKIQYGGARKNKGGFGSNEVFGRCQVLARHLLES